MNRKKILAFAIGPVLSAGLGFIWLPLIAWYFSPEDIGRNNVFQIFTSFSILLCILGLDQAFVREFHETKNRFSLFKVCFVPGLTLLLTLTIMALPFAGQISNLLYGKNEPYWYLVTASFIVSSFVMRFFSLILRMQERGLLYSISQIVPRIFSIVFLIGYAFFSSNHIFTYLLYVNFLSIFFTIIIFGWKIRADWIPAVTAKIDPVELKKVFSFGAPLIGAGVAYWGLSATSTIALRTFSDFKELGIYSMAMSFSGVALIFQGIFSTIWMPTVYKWVAANDNLSKIDVVVNYVLAAVCFIFALSGVFSWVIDYVLPVEYVQVKYIVICAMAQPLLYTLSETTVVGLNIKRKSMHALGIAIFSLISNAIFSIFLVPKYGAAGATISNALAYFVFFTARTEVSAHLWYQYPRRKLYICLIFVLMCAIVTAMLGPYMAVYFSLVWFIVFLILLTFFRSEALQFINFIFRNNRIS